MNFAMSRFAARTVFFAILVMAICGCGENIPGSTPTPIEADTPTLSPTSTEVVVVEASPTITEQPDLPTATATEAPLSEEGPWLIFVASPEQDPPSDYLWAINPDGTGLTQLTDKRTHHFEVNNAQGTDGEVAVAFITSASDDRYRDLQLSILNMPGGEIEATIDLTSPETAYIDQDPNDEDSDYWTVAGIAEAILTDGSFKWSPDGKWLAFVGAMDGPSADVYSYELATGTIRRLTSGADNAFQLLWSPDSAWILHTAKDIWLHSGGFYEPVSGVWAASPDGEQVITLEGARATQFIGWISPDTVVAYSGPAMGFSHALRTINVASKTVKSLEPVCFNQLAYSLEHNVYLVDVGMYGTNFCPLSPPWSEGLFLVSENDIQQMPDDLYQPGDKMAWSSDADMFLLGSSTGITLEGEVVTELPDSILDPSTAVSDDGSLRAWRDSGNLYIAAAPDYQANPVLLDGLIVESWPRPEWIP